MKYTLLYILLLLLFQVSFAQKDSLEVQYDNRILKEKEFDKSHIQEYRSDSDFNYIIKKREKPNEFQLLLNWLKRIIVIFLGWIFGVEEATGVFMFLLKVVPYIILIIVIGLLLKLFLKVNFSTMHKGSRKKASIFITEDEEIIKNKDISSLIQLAIVNGNYRLAIRYYYLLSLQKLQENDVIDWQQEKTNEDYIKEIQVQYLSSQFKNITHLYDFIWYGNFKVDEIDFNKAVVNFEQFNSLIK